MLSPNSTVIGTRSLKIGHYNANFSLYIHTTKFSLPTLGANDIMMVLWVITPTLSHANMQSDHAGD
jgi:hypothetical protein